MYNQSAKDRKLAERRLADLRAQVGRLSISDEAKARLSFDAIAARWMGHQTHLEGEQH